MDLRHAREELMRQKASLAIRTTRPQTWYEWLWSIPAPSKPQAAEDAAQNQDLRAHFLHMLDSVEPPDTFKPSAVTELLTPTQVTAMGYDNAGEALPAVYVLAFELRDFGACEILRKGKVLGDDVAMTDLDGPVRIRRLAD